MEILRYFDLSALLICGLIWAGIVTFLRLKKKKSLPYLLVFTLFFAYLVTVPIIGQSLLWGNCDKKLRWKKFFSDIFANLVTYLLIVLVFSFIV